MTAPLAPRVGSAIGWKTAQLAGVKLVLLLRTLVLARLLAPADFGLLAIALIAVDVLTAVTDFGMVPALVQKADAGRRHYDAAWTVNFTRSLLIAAAVVVAAPWIATVFAEPRATPLIRVMALRPLLEGAASIRVAELTRTLRFRAIALITLPDALVNAAVSIALAPTFGIWALVVGTLAGQVASVAASYLLAPYRPRLTFDRQATAPLVRFGRWVFITGVVAMAGSAALQAVISRRLGTADLGLYFLALKLASLPLEVTQAVVGAVAFPLFARLQADLLQAQRVFRLLLSGTAALLLPLCALVIALAPSLVADVLGPRWEGTAPLIQVLALTLAVGLLGETVVPALKGLGQPSGVLMLELIQSGVLIALAWALASRFGVLGAVLAWLPATALSQIASAVLIRRLLPQPFAGLGRPLFAITGVAGAGALVALAVDRSLPGWPGLATAALVSAVLMGLALWWLDQRLHLSLLDDLARVFPRLLRRTPSGEAGS